MRKEWIILVGQIVTGKSKFPHKRVGTFKRYKPFPYWNGAKPHKILYARSFLGTDAEAKSKIEQVEKEMFNTYIYGMGNLKHACVSDFTVLLHNITENKTIKAATTFDDDSSKNKHIFPGHPCSNKLLSQWKIVKGLN